MFNTLYTRLPDNLETHQHSWKEAILRVIELEINKEDKLYWEHELKAMQDMYDDLKLLKSGDH